MSIGNVSLATLREDLRERISAVAANNLSDDFIDRWLNVGQMCTYINIRDYIKELYTTYKTITINVADNGNSEIDLSSSNYFYTDWNNFEEEKHVIGNIWVNVITKQSDIDTVDIKELLERTNSTMHSTDNPAIAIVGNYIFFSESIATGDSFTVFYYRKPINMTSVLNLDVPDWAQNLVILYAAQQCFSVLGKDQEKISKDIQLEIDRVREMFNSNVKLNVLDKQIKNSSR
jgi:hypothetical protein